MFLLLCLGDEELGEEHFERGLGCVRSGESESEDRGCEVAKVDET